MIPKVKNAMMVALIFGGPLVVGLAIWWMASPPGFMILPIRDPDGYMGRIPPLTKMESYPRLVPWRLVSPPEADSTVLRIMAESYACNLSKKRPIQQVQETFDHVEVHETAHTIIIETWLGPPERDGFWPGCKGTGTGFPVQVELNSPLDDRQFVDPACDLDRYARWTECRSSFDNRWKTETNRAVNSP